MLKTRFITALILLPLVLLAIIFLPPLYFAAIFAALIAVGAWEWSGLVGITRTVFRVLYVVAILIGIFFANFCPVVIVLTAGAFVWLWFFAGILYYQKSERSVGFGCPIVRSIAGFVVLVSCWVAVMTLLVYAGFGAAWLIFVLFLIWSVDIGAYFAGRRYGKSQLVSRVSPKKTWAGFFGGTLSSIVVSAVGGWFFHFTWSSYFIFMALAVLTALVSVVGDLGISLLKRISGVKDSGNIIPGHGGVLDRLDSVAAASVVFVLLALLLGY